MVASSNPSWQGIKRKAVYRVGDKDLGVAKFF